MTGGIHHSDHSARLRTRLAPDFANCAGAVALRTPEDAASLWSEGHAVRGGRSAHRLLPAAIWGKTLRLRPARRGGILGPLLTEHFLRPDRILSEFDLWLELRKSSVPIPEPAFAISHRRGATWRSAIAIVDRPNAVDGLGWLESESRSISEVIAATKSAARALRALHDAGVLHGDLHLRNLLFSEPSSNTTAEATAAVECQLIDFDRARRVARISPADRLKEWMRLARSLEKTGHTAYLTPRLRASALAAYCGGDRELRRAMRAGYAREIRRLRRHRLGWRIRKLLPVALVCASLLGGGCSERDNASPIAPIENARLSLLAVGDTGRTRPLAALTEGQLAVASGMTSEAQRAKIDGVVLLGDNFYSDGLDLENLTTRVRNNLVRPYCALLDLGGPRGEEVASACRVPKDARTPVPFYAVLGNHDIEVPGSAELQRNAVPQFLPDWRMSSTLAQPFELGHGVSLILFESETRIEEREEIVAALRLAIRQAKGPWRILATHRPIATDDYGRPRIGGYPSFVRDAIAAEGLPVQLVLAGHHHSLQAFEIPSPTPLLQLGVGSGSRAEPPLASVDHPDVRFSRLSLGFARIDLIGQGEAERLVATLIETARWPILTPLIKPRAVAQFSVDRNGLLR
jgi:predicted MPP superfamily phosphohydrolase